MDSGCSKLPLLIVILKTDISYLDVMPMNTVALVGSDSKKFRDVTDLLFFWGLRIRMLVSKKA